MHCEGLRAFHSYRSPVVHPRFPIGSSIGFSTQPSPNLPFVEYRSSLTKNIIAALAYDQIDTLSEFPSNSQSSTNWASETRGLSEVQATPVRLLRWVVAAGGSNRQTVSTEISESLFLPKRFASTLHAHSLTHSRTRRPRTHVRCIRRTAALSRRRVCARCLKCATGLVKHDGSLLL